MGVHRLTCAKPHLPSNVAPLHKPYRNIHLTTVPRQSGPRILMRTLRIFTGLYLLGYVTSHLINLSLGLFSIDAMDAARPYLSGAWTGPVTGLILFGMLLVHYVIGLWSVYARPRIGGTAQDLVQALSGLAIIPLLAIHAIGVNMLERFGVDVDYNLIIRIFWVSNPGYGLTQVLLLSVAWVHGAAGLFMWLRSKRSLVGVLPWLYPLGVAVPVLALLGFTEAGRVVLISGIGPQVVQTNVPAGAVAPEIPFDFIIQVQRIVMWGSIIISLSVLGARAVRGLLAKPARVQVTTKGVGSLVADSGQTLLDALRSGGQPHANLCAGRGRCGTCAVRVLHSDIDLPAQTPLEQATLDRIDHGPDVRLACQLPLVSGGALSIARIHSPDYGFDHPDGDLPTAGTQVST